MTVKLTEKPFNLNETQVKWVEDTLAGMDLDAKIGQLFLPTTGNFAPEEMSHLTQDIKVAGVMIRSMLGESARQVFRTMQSMSEVPLLLSANLENGGIGVVAEGTLFSQPMGCAATGDMENGYRLGKISGQEAAAIGINWGYAPIIDIDNSYRNPITNVRAFSSDKEQVLELARGYIKGVKEEGIAATIKHFPGDGCDERDQHLLVSVNDRSAEEWYETYGAIYEALIEEGAPTVMVGHIAQPAVARDMNPQISREEACLPASQSKLLVEGVLREKYNFNGVVITDSTLMVGYMQRMPRKLALAKSIESGIDMILFNRNLDEDFRYMKENIEEGLVSMERVEDAVRRVLALKAMLKLPEKKAAQTLVPDTDLASIIGDPTTKAWCKELADKCVTLVKDNRKILPLSPKKHKRIYLNIIENDVVNQSAFALNIKSRLEKEGFEVTLRDRELGYDKMGKSGESLNDSLQKVMEEISVSTDEFVGQYDMAMIVLNMETVSNATVVRVDWEVMFGLGNDIPWYAGEMPLVVMSTANPYHLLDIPMAHTYINTYTNTPDILDAAFEKLMGRSEFKGISPVDAFCGHEDCMI